MADAEGQAADPVGLLLSDDLLFTSRITGTARALALRVQAVPSSAALLELAREQSPACVLIDLGNPGLEVGDWLRRLSAVCKPMPYVVAYGSHVDAAGLRAAREAGCNLVLPRSKFVEELPSALAGWMTAANAELLP